MTSWQSINVAESSACSPRSVRRVVDLLEQLQELTLAMNSCGDRRQRQTTTMMRLMKQERWITRIITAFTSHRVHSLHNTTTHAKFIHRITHTIFTARRYALRDLSHRNSVRPSVRLLVDCVHTVRLILIGKHALTFDWCHFWWPRSTFEGHFSLVCHFHVPRPFQQSLACFRVARSPSNSWASCWIGKGRKRYGSLLLLLLLLPYLRKKIPKALLIRNRSDFRLQTFVTIFSICCLRF